LYQRALRIREQVLGPGHPHVAHTLNSFARLYHDQGRYTEAEPLYQQALRIREQALGPQHSQTTETRTRFITLLRAMGQHEKAVLLEVEQPEL
jgi:tetratricopeptide (TPR) repeat protein